MASATFFCPWLANTPGVKASSSTTAGYPAGSAQEKKGAADKKTPSLAMGCGALVADRQKNWPTSFDFSQDYLHLDELFQHGAPVEYENNDGDAVKLCASE